MSLKERSVREEMSESGGGSPQGKDQDVTHPMKAFASELSKLQKPSLYASKGNRSVDTYCRRHYWWRDQEIRTHSATSYLHLETLQLLLTNQPYQIESWKGRHRRCHCCY